jgi:hypothetical protein
LAPGFGPGPALKEDALFAQQRREPQLEVASFVHQLLPITQHASQLAHFLRRQPDPRQVAHSLQVGQQSGVAVIALVGALLQSRHIAWVRQPHGPAGVGDQLVGQVGGAGAGFDGHFPRNSVDPNHSADRLPIIGAAAIG